MNYFLKKSRLVPFILAFFFLTVPLIAVTVHAQSSVSGDSVCGGSAATKCTFDDIGKIIKKMLTVIISIGLPVLVVIVGYRFVMAWFALQQGKTEAYHDALKKSGQAIFGFFIVVALFGGLLLVLLKYVGVSDGPLKILKMFSEAFIPHAYAQSTSTTLLPNFLPTNDLYTFLVSVLRMIVRFFIYPALIVIWVWTGFSFVTAQGNPDAIKKAKTLLLRAFITTLAIFLIQAFLSAISGSVKKILSERTVIVEKRVV